MNLSVPVYAFNTKVASEAIGFKARAAKERNHEGGLPESQAAREEASENRQKEGRRGRGQAGAGGAAGLPGGSYVWTHH